MNQTSKQNNGKHAAAVPDILRSAVDQLEVPTAGLAAIRQRGAVRRQRVRVAVASTCAVALVGAGALAVQRLSAPNDRTTGPGAAPTDSTAATAQPGPASQPVERVEPAYVWNLVVPGSSEALSTMFLGFLGLSGASITDDAPYFAWSTAPGPNTDGMYQPMLYRSDDGIHWVPAASSTFTEPEVSRRGLAVQGETLFAFGTAAATAAIPKGGAGDAVVDVSTDGGASWEHQVLPIDLRGLAAADGVGGVGLNGGMVAANGVVVVVAQPSVWWTAQNQGELVVTPNGAYSITYPTCPTSTGCMAVPTTVGPVAVGGPVEVPATTTTAPTDGDRTSTDDTLPVVSDLIPLSDLGIDPASVEAAHTPRAFFSTDGATFTEATFPELPDDVLTNGDMRVLASGGQFYVTISIVTFDPSRGYGYQTAQLIYRSADGATWEQVGDLTSFAGRDLLGVLPDGTMVARSYNTGGFADVATSVDGVTWVVHDLTPLIEPSDGEIVVIDPWAMTVDGGGITGIGYIRNDPIAEAGGRSIERDGVRLQMQSSLSGQMRAYDSATGDEIGPENHRYTDSSALEVLGDDGEVLATFTDDEWMELQSYHEGARVTRVLLHSDDGVHWSREDLVDLTGSNDAGPGFFQYHDGKVLITLVDPSQRTDTMMATTMVLVGTRK